MVSSLAQAGVGARVSWLDVVVETQCGEAGVDWPRGPIGVEDLQDATQWIVMLAALGASVPHMLSTLRSMPDKQRHDFLRRVQQIFGERWTLGTRAPICDSNGRIYRLFRIWASNARMFRFA